MQGIGWGGALNEMEQRDLFFFFFFSFREVERLEGEAVAIIDTSGLMKAKWLIWWLATLIFKKKGEKHKFHKLFSVVLGDSASLSAAAHHSEMGIRGAQSYK